MGTKAHGRILFWEGASLWILSAPPGQKYPKTDPHRHHVVQVTLALTGRIDFDVDGGRASGDAIAIAPNALHAFEGTGLVAHLFVDSDGKAGRQMAHALFSKGPIASIPSRQLGDFPARLKASFDDPRQKDDDLRVLGQSLMARLAGEGAHADAPDPRISKLIAWVARRLDEAVTLSDAAQFMACRRGGRATCSSSRRGSLSVPTCCGCDSCARSRSTSDGAPSRRRRTARASRIRRT